MRSTSNEPDASLYSSLKKLDNEEKYEPIKIVSLAKKSAKKNSWRQMSRKSGINVKIPAAIHDRNYVLK